MPTVPNDTTTTLSRGALDGDAMDESQVTQRGDGATKAKRARVVVGDDDGNIFGVARPMPTLDDQNRYVEETRRLATYESARIAPAITARHRERFSVGERGRSLDCRGQR